ncbi:uncharacterized protein LOC135207010 [Macrobrachium nipponense]|uniref:uncharacterized protein LOC135207010 n=1 Tax=Macrobrachium nipponense TaxID=159736 RepID=UPI0030C85888
MVLHSDFRSSRVIQKKPVNFFECPPDKELEKEDAEPKKKPPVENNSKQTDSLANPLRVDALPSPFGDDNSLSVFYNPFQKAQEDKKLLLEKHVKMTENPKDVVEINGKKICWNYRKGRCKFGHNCKYAHDSDVIQQADPSLESKDRQTSAMTSSPSGWSYGELANYTAESESVTEESDLKRKKRPGLSTGLVPNKKVLKMYRKQQAKESPWKFNN